MIRYQGEGFSKAPNVGIVANDALGNFVVCTPLAQALSRMFPGCHVDYYGGTRTQELQIASNLYRSTRSVLGTPPSDWHIWLATKPQYDLIINVESSPYAASITAQLCGPDTKVVGHCLGTGGRGTLPFSDDTQGQLQADPRWISEDLVERFSILKSPFIGEIFCRLAYFEGEIPRYSLPSEDPGTEIPDVLIAMSASLGEKLWPLQKWVETLSTLKSRGLSVGLIGAPPKKGGGSLWLGDSIESGVVEANLVEDLRGKFSLPQVVGALAKAKAVLTLDNGILHMAVSGGKPVVGLFRNGIHRLWAPPFDNIRVLVPEPQALVETIPAAQVLDAMSYAI